MKHTRFMALLITAFLVLCGFTERPNSSLRWFNHGANNFAVWAPFGTEQPGAIRFQDWVLQAASEQPLVAFNNQLVLNCWEYVLYTSLRIKNSTLTNVKSLYAAVAQGQLLSSVLGTTLGRVTYKVDQSKVTLNWSFVPRAGDVVFMDETSHVVQATGTYDSEGRVEVVSFSPRPIWGDGSRTWAEPSTRPEVTTLESLIEEMIALYPDVPTDWNGIELKVIRPHGLMELSKEELPFKKKSFSLESGDFTLDVKWKKAQQTSDEVDVLYGRVEFKPKSDSSAQQCKNISFIQTARVLDNAGKDYQWPLGQTARNLIMTKGSRGGVSAGYFIDHDATRCAEESTCSPFYRDSWPNTQDGSRDGMLTTNHSSSAVLVDYPFGWEFISSISLEACAVCRDDMRIFGCAMWGGRWPITGGRSVDDLNASEKPSGTFLDALRRFRKHYRQ